MTRTQLATLKTEMVSWISRSSFVDFTAINKMNNSVSIYFINGVFMEILHIFAQKRGKNVSFLQFVTRMIAQMNIPKLGWPLNSFHMRNSRTFFYNVCVFSPSFTIFLVNLFEIFIIDLKMERKYMDKLVLLLIFEVLLHCCNTHAQTSIQFTSFKGANIPSSWCSLFYCTTLFQFTSIGSIIASLIEAT